MVIGRLIVNSYLHLTNDLYMTSNETDQQTIDGSKTAKQQQVIKADVYYIINTLITYYLLLITRALKHRVFNFFIFFLVVVELSRLRSAVLMLIGSRP